MRTKDKINLLLLCVQIISMVSVCVCTWWFCAVAERVLTAPYGLSRNFVEISISDDGRGDEERLMDDFFAVVRNAPVTLVLDNLDSIGLGVYDPQQQLAGYPLDQGSYLSKNAYAMGELAVLVQVDTPFQRYYAASEQAMTIGGTSSPVVGLYSAEHPLATASHPFVYPLSAGHTLTGSLFVDSSNPALVDDIGCFLDGRNYDHRIVARGATGTVLPSILRAIADDRFSLLPLACLAMMTISWFLLYHNVFSALRRQATVSLYFGATRSAWLWMQCKQMVPFLAGGALLGAAGYQALFALAYPRMVFSWGTMAALVLAELVANLVVWLPACFAAFRRAQRGGGWYV